MSHICSATTREALVRERWRSWRARTFTLDELRYEYPDEVGATEEGAHATSRSSSISPGSGARRALSRRPASQACKAHHRARASRSSTSSATRPISSPSSRSGALRQVARHPLPGPRLGGQLGGLLLPRHHGGRPGAPPTSCSSASSRAERGEPPDIDVDFEHQRREEVIQYIYEKYGRDRAGLTADRHLLSRAAGRSATCRQGPGALRWTGSPRWPAALWGWSHASRRSTKRIGTRAAGSIPATRRLRHSRSRWPAS